MSTFMARRRVPATKTSKRAWLIVGLVVVVLLLALVRIRTIALREEIRTACMNGNDLLFLDQVQMRRICREFTPHPVPKTRGGKTYFL
jgi:hypothetical protein